ncbi:hypothetical protein [Streptomyces sp. NPDC091294]|uniref:hypothetical protein n=1 Tax=Streptomyces sp. NPDC091294 TaxID=3365992 RepID=UPI00382F54C6
MKAIVQGRPSSSWGFRFEGPEAGDQVDVGWNDATTTPRQSIAEQLVLASVSAGLNW